MAKLITWVFLLNIAFRYALLKFDETNNGLLFILTRLLLLAFVVFYWFYAKRNTFDINIIAGIKWLILSLLMMGASFLIVLNVNPDQLHKYVLHFFKCLSVGGVEEFFSRYLMFSYFFAKYKRYPKTIFVVSFIFALLHISSLIFGSGLYSFIVQFEMAFLLGLILQYIFITTKNLLIVISIHTIINFWGTYQSLGSTYIRDKMVSEDFIFSQLSILIIYLIVIPLFLWGLKINKYH